MPCLSLRERSLIEVRAAARSLLYFTLCCCFTIILDVRIKEHIIDLQGNRCVPLVCHRQCGPNHFIPKDNPSVGNEFLDNREHTKIVLKYPLNE